MTSNTFKIPIQYNTHKCIISKELLDSMDLLTTPDATAEPVFTSIFKPSNTHTTMVLYDMVQTYTTDTQYLKDAQTLICTYKENPSQNKLYTEMVNALKCITSDTFISTYGYIEYSHLKFMNEYSVVLQMMSWYTMVSPAITIATPLIILILPFVILNVGFQYIDFASYMAILKKLGKNHPVIGLITDFGSLSQEQQLYQILTILVYLFSIYRQCMDCYAFIQNIKTLTSHLVNIKEYVTLTIQSMRHFSSFTYQLSSHDAFNQSLSKNINDLMKIQSLLDGVSEFKWSFSTLKSIGGILQIAYTMYTDPEVNSILEYSIHFNAYMELFEKIHGLYNENKLSVAVVCKNRKPKIRIKNMIYPAYVNNPDVVSNNITMGKNIIITGPNASGKTTILKSLLLNVLFTQQHGMGFYTNAKITPFKYLHCYINIPDTTGRDSLFQAEARRCKSILDAIWKHPDGKHLCIFDELYSGTNPEEAIYNSMHFLQYITKKPNVKWLLTTHFIELCKQLKSSSLITNVHMQVSKDFKYLYKLKPDISTVKGAYKILEDMNFPKELIGNSLISKK